VGAVVLEVWAVVVVVGRASVVLVVLELPGATCEVEVVGAVAVVADVGAVVVVEAGTVVVVVVVPPGTVVVVVVGTVSTGICPPRPVGFLPGRAGRVVEVVAGKVVVGEVVVGEVLVGKLVVGEVLLGKVRLGEVVVGVLVRGALVELGEAAGVVVVVTGAAPARVLAVELNGGCPRGAPPAPPAPLAAWPLPEGRLLAGGEAGPGAPGVGEPASVPAPEA
jgi:hypothetical protein